MARFKLIFSLIVAVIVVALLTTGSEKAGTSEPTRIELSEDEMNCLFNRWLTRYGEHNYGTLEENDKDPRFQIIKSFFNRWPNEIELEREEQWWWPKQWRRISGSCGIRTKATN